MERADKGTSTPLGETPDEEQPSAPEGQSSKHNAENRFILHGSAEQIPEPPTFSTMATDFVQHSIGGVSETTTTVAMGVIQHASNIVEVVHIWASIASIHGVPYMLDKNFKLWRKLIWALVLLLATFGMTAQIRSLLIDFRRHIVNTNIMVQAKTSINFPELVICNEKNINWTLANQLNLSEPTNETELIMISQPKVTFLLFATFAGRDLDIEESFETIATDRGVCFRYRTDQQVTSPGALPGAGRNPGTGTDGLTFALYIDQTNYGSLGAFVYVASKNATEPNQMPVVVVGNGEYTFVGVKQTIISRDKELPWSKCNTTAPSWYTREKCRAQCYHDAYYEAKNCSLWGDLIPRSSGFCPPEEQYDKDEATADKARVCDELNCALPPCQAETYTTRVSSARVPRETDEAWNDLLDDIAVVSINYEDMTIEKITEEKAMTRAQMLGSVGGAMGLFLGISTLSLIELLGELVVLRLLPRLWGDTRLYGIGSKEHRN